MSYREGNVIAFIVSILIGVLGLPLAVAMVNYGQELETYWGDVIMCFGVISIILLAVGCLSGIIVAIGCWINEDKFGDV